MQVIMQWFRAIENAKWSNHSSIKDTFTSADNLGNDRYCFNVGGNNFRVIAIVLIRDGEVEIEEILTHAEYNKRNY